MHKRRRTTEAISVTTDPREVPAYGIREAAHYLQLPVATLKSWVLGRSYPTAAGPKRFAPVIELPDARLASLSFINLVEAHILSAFRRKYKIELRKIRSALGYVRKEFDSQHPLIEQRFETDGAALFIDRLGLLVDASAKGQIVMQSIRPYFRRLEFDNERVVRLYPFTHSTPEDSPKAIFIDPRYSFGRPSLSSSHVATAMIAERYKAGESVAELAADYGCNHDEIEEAVRCELDPRIAA
ncbi:MAG: DUF433 domain-containing protein [Planctomycetaceae bacterium]